MARDRGAGNEAVRAVQFAVGVVGLLDAVFVAVRVLGLCVDAAGGAVMALRAVLCAARVVRFEHDFARGGVANERAVEGVVGIAGPRKFLLRAGDVAREAAALFARDDRARGVTDARFGAAIFGFGARDRGEREEHAEDSHDADQLDTPQKNAQPIDLYESFWLK